MAKPKSIFVCQNCGQDYPRWQGRCDSCGEWNTLVEETKAQPAGKSNSLGGHSQAPVAEMIRFSEVDRLSASKQRFSTGIGEVDRVLGGEEAGKQGIVPGSVMLLGGEPGIGKSTLLTQVVLQLIHSYAGGESEVTAPTQSTPKKSQSKLQLDPKVGTTLAAPILYVAGEESPHQISMRIDRIVKNEHFLLKNKIGKHLGEAVEKHLVFSTSTDIDSICSLIRQINPKLVIIDSIQTMTTSDLTGASGSVGQIREVTERIIETVKPLHVPAFLIGHVTKEGTIAGPKVLEHMVDTVMELSGERTGQLRILRTIKNRFGATDEVGVFQVSEWGLEEVTNPSQLFLEGSTKSVPGSTTVCVMEGTRPLLLEVQALVVDSQLAMPRRVGRGIELSRIQVLAAVLQKHAHLPLGTTDIFLSVAGGFAVKEPAVDLGLAVAIASSLKNKAVPEKTIFIGEVGLLGEIRKVQYLERRIKEAKRLGFEHIISRNTHATVREVVSAYKLS